MLGYLFVKRRAGSAIQWDEFLANVECTGDPFVGSNRSLASDDDYARYRLIVLEYVGVSLKGDGV